jgi:chemotaxis protein MotB
VSAVGAGDHAHGHEIIIVRHAHGDHDEAHHGGVWKIAFADFMTAMMCFFLVMWLISAANEQTKAAVASYFNPVKLIDRNSSRKGLEDVGDGPNAIGDETDQPQTPDATSRAEGLGKGGAEAIPNSQDADADKKYSDEHLFANPYAVLAEIAANTGRDQNISPKGDGGAETAGPATGASGGESYRDPFAPDFWTKQVEAPAETEANRQTAIAESQMTAIVKSEDKAAEQKTAEAKVKADAARMEAAPVETKPAEMASADIETAKPKTDGPETKPLGELFRPGKADTTTKPDMTKPDADKREVAKPETHDLSPTQDAIEKAKEIKREIAEAMGTGDKLGNGLDVVATDKGVTISVTDEFDFGMFEIGSALPHRDLVLAMEKIGKVLAAQKGAITINGHTDGRPFKSEAYDNWRLSTARAHSAYYMLVRAGLDEKRITEVAGFADRKLKIKDDPFNAANRRIEILLEVGQ